jgi:hypothetical protein
MNVELAEERILLLPDKLGAAQAEGRAWSKRIDAFGAFAKLGGFINKPKDEDYEVVYRELRLQPFWRLDDLRLRAPAPAQAEDRPGGAISDCRR